MTIKMIPSFAALALRKSEGSKGHREAPHRLRHINSGIGCYKEGLRSVALLLPQVLYTESEGNLKLKGADTVPRSRTSPTRKAVETVHPRVGCAPGIPRLDCAAVSSQRGLASLEHRLRCAWRDEINKDRGGADAAHQ